MKIASRTKWVLIGDSITDAGRDPSGEPTPWNRATGLGSGYVAMTQALLDALEPASRIRCINRGVSGQTIADLQARWDADVLDVRPDWVSVMIGINDVWRQFDCPLRTETHVLPDRYEEIYRNLLERTLPSVAGMVLMTPFVIDSNEDDSMRREMVRYGSIVRSLSQEYGTLFVDTQAVFDRLMLEIPATELAWDRIHPGQTGHMALACALLDVVGFSRGGR